MADQQDSEPLPSDAVDLRMFQPREVARLLAQRVAFGLGHYKEDDPYTDGQGVDAKQ
jgi:hypothetical protein